MTQLFAQVGGLLLCRVHLLSAPTDLIIHSVKAKVVQHFHITSPHDSSRHTTPPIDTRTAFTLDGAHPPNFGDSQLQEKPPVGPLKVLKAGESYQIHHLGRMPHHDVLRPSTSELTDTAIRVRHEIVLEVIYQIPTTTVDDLGRSKVVKGKSKEEEAPKRLAILRDLTIFSVSSERPTSSHGGVGR